MRRTRVHALLLVACLMVASNAHGATISWTLPNTYKDGHPIASSDVKRIVVEAYSGPTKDGPWIPVAVSSPGATAVMVPDPPPARTRWYTVKSTLDGAESDFAVPVRRTNYSIPVLPLAKKIAKKAIAHKKAVFLMLVGIVLGLAWRRWYRGHRGRG
jgi:hypothetical protein